jgi:glycosyltransferase involved in cell wall biosynthesis
LRQKGVNFEISVLGESFSKQPEVFKLLADDFKDHIRRWGYQQSRADYYSALMEADVFVSTAEHEFFGVSLMEAASCSTVPLAPERLAYPEVLLGHDEFLYGGTARTLAEKLQAYTRIVGTDDWLRLQQAAHSIAGRFFWGRLTERFDRRIEEVIKSCRT